MCSARRSRTWLLVLVLLGGPGVAPAADTKATKPTLQAKLARRVFLPNGVGGGELDEAMQFLEKRYDIPIRYYRPAFKKENVALEEVMARKVKRMTFRDVPLGDVLRQLLAEAGCSYRVHEDWIRVIPAAKEVKIDTPVQAIVVLTNGRRYVGRLQSLDSKQVRFRPRAEVHVTGTQTRLTEVAGAVTVYPAKDVKAVQTEDEVYVYNAERGVFEVAEGLQEAIVIAVGGGRFGALIAPLDPESAKEVDVRVVLSGKRSPAKLPLREVRKVITSEGIWTYNKETGALDFKSIAEAVEEERAALQEKQMLFRR
jgi:hypothetical protein